MQDDALERCQQLLDYEFKDPDLLSQALTHASIAKTRLESNERLEFLGDAVLGLIVCHELYVCRPDLLEGEMTKIKSAVVSRQTCAVIAEEIEISRHLSLGKGLPGGDSLPTSVSAAVFESIIGAIYLDGGLAPARRFIMQHLSAHIEEALENEHQHNYKSLLQQHSQRRWGATPDYLLLDEKGPDHSKAFEVAVSIGGRHFPSAWGMSKKQAEQLAAHRALTDMGLIDGDPEPELEEFDDPDGLEQSEAPESAGDRD